MKVKVREATGPTLNWMVMLAQGWTMPIDAASSVAALRTAGPANSWSQGGPIIEREEIDLNCSHNEGQSGGVWDASCVPGVVYGGDTPLIAAMRCYVASKLGDEVEVPDLLLESK